MTTYFLTESIKLSIGVRVTRLSNAIYYSPMVDERYMTSFFTSVSYSF
ncbi:MipA/OmpV family protein [Klebsiella sp. BIGb0407]